MINEEEFEDFVHKIALENAVSFGGTANPKALIGKCIPQYPDMKNDMAHYMNLINNIVKQVNETPAEEQKARLKIIKPDFFEKKEKKEEKKDPLPELPNMPKDLKLRFSPAPSGHLHIGHLFSVVFNYAYAKKYDGKFLLRLEDTNPEKISKANYDKIIEDVKWVTDDGIDEIIIQSDRIDIYYKYLRTLIDLNRAYVCECSPEVFKPLIESSTPCPHRNQNIKKQTENYEKFFKGQYKDGDAVIRFKADLNNKNPALRDFPLARLKSEPHVRLGSKYRLWPMYNLCTAIDDSLMVNYIIRGKDHEINGIRQDMLKDALNLPKCSYFHFGRMKFEDVELSKSKLSVQIDEGKLTGWDDPRAPTLISYKKRGYKAEAFRNMIIASGLSKRDSRITSAEFHKSLDFHNKQVLEKECDRYFFIHNPKKIHIEDVTAYPEKEITLPKHPEQKERGSRHFKLENEYFIDSLDFDNIDKGDTIRLMHFANFEVKDKTKDTLKLKYHSKEFDRKLKLKRNIHFLPKNSETCEIILSDASQLKGLCENTKNLKEGSCIQFERFGFARYDSNNEEGKKVFYYAHR